MEKGAWRSLGRFCLGVARRFYNERGLQAAGSLSYTTLFSLVPLLTVALAISTAFPVFDTAMSALQSFMAQNFLPNAHGIDTITRQIRAFTENAGRLTAIGLASFAVTAVLLMMTIDEALNHIFQVGRRRALLQQVLIYWAVLTLGPLLIGGSLSVTSFAVSASLGRLHLDVLADPVLRVLPFVFECAAFTLLYRVVPNRRVQFSHALFSAIIAALLFEAAKRAFSVYLAHVPTYRLIYGAFATIPIFLVWLYVSWIVVLVGATLAAMLPEFGVPERRPVAGRDFADELAVLTALARAQAEGRRVPLRRLSARLRLSPQRCEAALERAAALGWAIRAEGDAWVLARDADGIPLREVYRALVLDAEALGVREGDLGLSLREYAEAKGPP